MRTIVFAILPGASHVEASMALATALKRRGHRIVYVGAPDDESRVVSRGFEFETVYADVFPLGSTAADGGGFLRLFASGGEVLRNLLRRPDLDAVLSKLQPAIVVADSVMPFVALAALRLGLRAVLLYTILPSDGFDPKVPPLMSVTHPGPGVLTRARIVAEWLAVLARHEIDPFVRTYRREMARMIREAGLAPSTLLRTEFGPSVDLPDLVLACEQFDLPRGIRKPARHYVGPCVDLARPGAGFPWESLPGDGPVVYASLGTQLSHKLFFEHVLAAARLRPGWRVILSVGNRLSRDDFRDVPPHVFIASRVPQIDVLSRARVMITHGGINSVKECIAFAVPMVVFPGFGEQSGNAVRVEFHGLGIRGDRDLAERPERYAAAIDRVLEEPGFANAARRMQDLSTDAEPGARGADVIESMMAK